MAAGTNRWGRSDWLAQLEGRARCTGASEMDRPSSSSASTLSLSSEMAFRAAEIDLHARPDRRHSLCANPAHGGVRGSARKGATAHGASPFAGRRLQVRAIGLITARGFGSATRLLP